MATMVETNVAPVTRTVRWLLTGSWSVVLVMAVLKAATVARGFTTDAWALDLLDPDNYVRLAQIRDWLSGQSWFDVTQYRIDPPSGMHTHWSRLADLPAGLPIWLLTPLTGAALAERLALVLTPLLLLVAAFALIVKAADGLAGPSARFPAAVVTLYAAKMQWEFVPGRIDHHALQIVLILALVTALVTGERARHGWLAALAAALSLGVGMEAAPYVAIAAVWVALRWAWRGDAAQRVTTSFMAGIAVLVPLVFVLTVPIADWWLPKGDAIGRGHVAAALLLGGALALTAARTGRPRAVRFGMVIGFAAIGGSVVLAAFPEVVGEPYAMVGPLLLRLWIANISETRSVVQDWALSPSLAIARLAFGVVMVGVGALLAWRAAGTQRDRLALATGLALIGMVLGGWQYRSLALGAAVALPLAGAAIAVLLARSLAAAMLGVAAAAVLLLADALVPVPHALAAGPRDADCLGHANWPDIARLPPGLVLGQINLAGPFLVWTPHSVLSSGMHRGHAGIRFSFETWMAKPDAALQQAAVRGVRYVAVCTTSGETTVLSKTAPRGLVAALKRGEVPAGLIPVAHGGNAALKVFRLAPAVP